MQARRNRQTGTIIWIGRAEEFDLEPTEGAWVTICEEHAWTIHHATKAVALAWAARPLEWCEVCQMHTPPRGFVPISSEPPPNEA